MNIGTGTGILLTAQSNNPTHGPSDPLEWRTFVMAVRKGSSKMRLVRLHPVHLVNV